MIPISRILLTALIVICLFGSAYAQKGGGGAAPLNEVTHDTTLVGKGTAASPLSVADNGIGTAKLGNGAVTHSKIGSSNLPTAGQTLTFNGTGLVWASAPPTSGLRYVDATESEIGPFFTLSSTIVFVPEIQQWVSLGLETTGFYWIFYYTSSDCSGVGRPPVQTADGFYGQGIVADGLLYYPNGPSELITFHSFRNYQGCFASTTGVNISPFASKPFSFSPPFKLAR